MPMKLCGTALTCLFLLIIAASAAAQQTPPVQKPQPLSTVPRPVKAVLLLDRRAGRNIEGVAAFAVSEARPDDTLAGTLVYNLPEDARRQIAEAAKRQLAEIPSSVARKDLIVFFKKGTACPELEVEIPALDLEVAGVTLRLKRFDLHIAETPQELPRLFCVWTRLINARYENRQGVVRRINRLLKGEEE